MRLTSTQIKIFTSVMMLVCLLLLVGWPVLLGERPGARATLAANKEYAVRFVSYLSFMVFALVLAGVGAIGVLRTTTAEYKAQQMENMRELIEASMADHEKKSHDVD